MSSPPDDFSQIRTPTETDVSFVASSTVEVPSPVTPGIPPWVLPVVAGLLVLCGITLCAVSGVSVFTGGGLSLPDFLAGGIG